LLNGVEAIFVEIGQIRGLEDGKVHIAFDKLIMDHVLWGVLLILFQRPHVIGWGEVLVIGVEAIDPASTIFVQLVRGAGIPEMGVTVNNENLFSVFGAIHGVLCLLFVNVSTSSRK
jgi:hypothetical protein